MKFTFFQKIKFINKINNAWKESKKLIDGNRETTEEARQIALELINIFERIAKLLPPATSVVEGLIEIIKNALK